MAKVLVIDDDALLLKTTRNVLEQAGYEVVTAGDGSDGLAKFGMNKPDIVLVDIIMPTQDGIETIMALRGINAKTPIIAMSGGGASGTMLFLDMAGKLGADRILAKPVRRADLLSSIDSLLPRTA